MKFWGSRESRSRNFIGFSQIPCNGWLWTHKAERDTLPMTDDITPHVSRSRWNQTDLESVDRCTTKSHISEQITSLSLSSAGKSLNVRIPTKDLGSCVTNHHLSSPLCSLHSSSAVTGSLKIHCLGEKQLHHLLTALYLSFLVCKIGVLHFIQRIIMRSIEIKHVKCLVQGLAHRKCLVTVSCYLVRHFQYCNTHMDF